MKTIILSFFLSILLIPLTADAQVLKGLGRRIENKVIDRIDRRADRSVDKVLDKADREIDKPFDGALNKSPSDKTDKQGVEVLPSNDAGERRIAIPASAEEGLVLMSDNCTDFIWFREGAFMEFEAREANGKILQKSRMTVKGTVNEGDILVADVEASDDDGNSFEMKYKCVGDAMYMDFGALMQDAMEKAGRSGADAEHMQRAMENTEIGFTDGFLSFPKNMYVGQVLDPVSMTIKSTPTPQVSMEIVSTQRDRQVVAMEKVTTPAGTFDCLRLASVRTSNIRMMGMNKEMPTSVEHVWFAPRIGIIKQENYSENGKLESMSQLTAYSL